MLSKKQIQSLKPLPLTGGKGNRRRGYYTTTQLNKMFPDQKRNKTIEELFTGIKMTL